MGKIFQKPYTVTYYDSDMFGSMKLSQLLNVCMYYSGLQSHVLGRGDDYIEALNLTWVVTNYEMTIHRMPLKDEEIVIFTEPTSYNKFFCYRNFWVQDKEGNSIVSIQSTFALMNRDNRKMAAIQDEVLTPYESEKVKKIRRAPQFKELTNGNGQAFLVRFSELDSNQHVNNTKYIDWVLDVLPFDFRKEHILKTARLRYAKEIEWGTTIQSQWQEEKVDGEIHTHHNITAGGQVHFEATLTWRKR